VIVKLAIVILLQFLSKPQSQGQNADKFDSKELDPHTRPIVEIPQFKDMKCVTVSAYRMKNPKTKKLEVTRVFRFTYKADYTVEVANWSKTYSKGRWIVDKKSVPLIIYDRDLKHPKVVRQTIMLHGGKATFETKARAQTKATKEAGWVWVSFNETIKDPTW
jgi:hypothetical protein